MTKNSEKALVILYSEYLRRRSFGTAISDAAIFEDGKIYAIKEFSSWMRSDINSCISELTKVGYVKSNIIGDITLQPEGITYMEKQPKEFFAKFTDTVKDLLTLAAAFLPI